MALKNLLLSDVRTIILVLSLTGKEARKRELKKVLMALKHKISVILNASVTLYVDDIFLCLLLEQEAENDGESSGAEDEGSQTDHQRHGKVG